MLRFKVKKRTAVYHCMSRTVAGSLLFEKREKEVLRKMIWQVADFSGVEVLTYAVMGNHFHVLARVPLEDSVSDAELVRRFTVLYPKPNNRQMLSPNSVAKILEAGGDEADALRSRLIARMGDISAFMKTLKQRFSIWFNQTHDRFGTLWAERFKSVLVEGMGNPLQTMAAYIDLNPVRAGLVEDPKDYRFCGYGEAVGGQAKARQGLTAVWSDRIEKKPETPQRPSTPFEISEREGAALRCHRNLIYTKGEADQIIPREQVVRTLETQKAILPRSAVLRCRVRYFTEGAIFGTKDFVRSFAPTWQTERRRNRPPKVHELEGAKWGDLATIRKLRTRVYS